METNATQGAAKEVQEYKASILIMIRDIFYGIFAGAALALIVYFVTQNELYCIIAAVVGFVIVGGGAILGTRFRVEVDANSVRVYKGSKLKHDFDRATTAFGYHVRSQGADSTCTMRVLTADGKKDYVDCSALGQSRFMKMMDEISTEEGETLATIKPESDDVATLETKQGE